MSLFKKAVKSQAKLRLSLTGPAGSGKTYSALSIAVGLANDGRVALVDTEHGSAKKHSGEFEFDVMEMEPPFHPDRFVEAIKDASAAGYAVLVLDSLSHAWNGTGGLLELVEQFAARGKTANSFAAWKDATPIQNRLVDAIVRADIHIIATMRSKTEYVVEQVERNGRTVTVPRKIGTSPIQRDSFEYEFDIVADLDLDHNLIVSKTRYRGLDGAVIAKPSQELGQRLATWLSDGAEPVIRPTDHFKPAEPTPQPEAPKTNGNGGNGIGVTTGAELLELVNRRVGVPYDNVFHLQEAIKGDLPGFKWPSPKDKDGWQRAYDVAMAHARAKEQPEAPTAPVEDELPF